MAISLEDAMKLFHRDVKDLRDPLHGQNPLLREINEALTAGVPESQIINTLVSQYRDAKDRASRAKVTTIHREMDEYAVDRD